MTGHRINRRGAIRGIPVIALLLCFASAALAANKVTGLVRNQSRSQPAIGDEVILVRLDRVMQEEARTKTDGQGAFSLTMQHPGIPYLVRVIHQNVNYDERVSADDSLSVQVFDASPHVPDVAGTIEILRAGTIGKLLHVSDMYEIVNTSSPPLTQAGERTFEVYLPANAKLDSVLAAGPEKIGVMISATLVSAQPGHYSVNYPLRPGATKFAFNYDLPYPGHAAFQTRRAYPVRQLAVMIPPAMKFSSLSPDFGILATGNTNYQVEAANHLPAGEGPRFELSGAGAMPPVLNQTNKDQTNNDQTNNQANSPVQAIPSSTVSASDRFLLPSLPQARSRANSQLSSPARPKAWIRSLTWTIPACLLLTACLLIVRRARNIPNSAARRATTGEANTQFADAKPMPLLAGLKEALFQLETERIRGSISAEEYTSARHALEETIKRALARNAHRPPIMEPSAISDWARQAQSEAPEPHARSNRA